MNFAEIKNQRPRRFCYDIFKSRMYAKIINLTCYSENKRNVPFSAIFAESLDFR